MANDALSTLLGRLATDDALCKEFCANPAKVLQREGVVVPANEIPKTVDYAEFSKRLKAAVASGATTVNLGPFAVGSDVDAEESKHLDIQIGIKIPILHIDTKIGSHNDDKDGSGSGSGPGTVDGPAPKKPG